MQKAIKSKVRGGGIKLPKRSPRITRARAHLITQASIEPEDVPEAQPAVDEYKERASKLLFSTPLEIEEVEVPPEGSIYEEGNVWEVAPAPPPTPISTKGILKTIASLKRKAKDESTADEKEEDSDSSNTKVVYILKCSELTLILFYRRPSSMYPSPTSLLTFGSFIQINYTK